MVLVGLGGENAAHAGPGGPPAAAATAAAAGAAVLPMPAGAAGDLHVIWPEEDDNDDWLEEAEGEVIGLEEEEEPEEGEEDEVMRYVSFVVHLSSEAKGKIFFLAHFGETQNTVRV